MIFQKSFKKVTQQFLMLLDYSYKAPALNYQTIAPIRKRLAWILNCGYRTARNMRFSVIFTDFRYFLLASRSLLEATFGPATSCRGPLQWKGWAETAWNSRSGSICCVTYSLQSDAHVFVEKMFQCLVAVIFFVCYGRCCHGAKIVLNVILTSMQCKCNR